MRWCAENVLLRWKCVGAREFVALVSMKKLLVPLAKRWCAENTWVRDWDRSYSLCCWCAENALVRGNLNHWCRWKNHWCRWQNAGARKMRWCAEIWAGALRVKFVIFFLLVRWLRGWCAGTFSNYPKIIITIFFHLKNIILVISMSKLIKKTCYKLVLKKVHLYGPLKEIGLQERYQLKVPRNYIYFMFTFLSMKLRCLMFENPLKGRGRGKEGNQKRCGVW